MGTKMGQIAQCVSAADEQTRHANANWGPRSVVLAIQTHSDGVRRCAGWQPDPGRARLSRPAAAQTALGRVQASYPLLSQVKLTSLRPALHLSILTAMSSDAQAQGCSSSAQRDLGRTGPAETVDSRHLSPA